MKGMLKTFVALAATALFWSSQANAVLIEVVPSAVSGSSGEIVTIDVVASDLNGDVISAYDILFAFDDTFFSGASVWTPGFGLGWHDFLSFEGAFVAGPGLVDFSELSLLSDTDFIDFGYQDGIGPLTLFSYELTATADFTDAVFSLIWDEFHDVKCADNAVCSPTAVPEPGTLALLGIGLLGMAASRRRRKS